MKYEIQTKYDIGSIYYAYALSKKDYKKHLIRAKVSKIVLFGYEIPENEYSLPSYVFEGEHGDVYTADEDLVNEDLQKLLDYIDTFYSRYKVSDNYIEV